MHVVVVVDPINLSLKFCDNLLYNSWVINGIEFLWEVGYGGVDKVIIVSNQILCWVVVELGVQHFVMCNLLKYINIVLPILSITIYNLLWMIRLKYVYVMSSGVSIGYHGEGWEECKGWLKENLVLMKTCSVSGFCVKGLRGGEDLRINTPTQGPI